MAGIIFSKSSGLNNSVYGNSAEPIKFFMEMQAKSKDQISIAEKVFKPVESDAWAYKLGGMTGYAEDFEPSDEGGEYPLNERQEAYSKTIIPVTWKSSFVITQEMVEDQKVIDVKRTGAAAFIDKYHTGRERFASALLVGGISATTATYSGRAFDTTTADGVKLFSTAHTSISGNAANQSNLYANAFSTDALGMISTAMTQYLDDQGEILTVTPDTIVIPNNYTLKKAVFEAVGSDKDPDTANNGFNFLFGSWRVIVSPYLNPGITTYNTPYFIMDSKYCDYNDCLLWVNRIPLTVKSDIDQNTDNNVWRGRARFSAGFFDWRGISVGGIAEGALAATTLS